jgi:hypothetical protein
MDASLSNLRVTPESSVTENDTMRSKVDVTNEGARAAEETVFLFTHDKLASVARPLLELKGFAKITGARRGGHRDAVVGRDCGACASSASTSSRCSSRAKSRFWWAPARTGATDKSSIASSVSE